MRLCVPFKDVNAIRYFKDWRLLCFGFGLFLFALWGSPTPNNPDWVEAAIAICLFLAVSWQSLTHSFLFHKNDRQEYWLLATKIFFLYGLSVPLIMGVVNGWPLQSMLRDGAALIFLCLPLFLSSFIKTKQAEQFFFILCLVIGLLFSIRVLVPHFLLFRNTTELLYLANSPLVLMSAIFLSGFAAYQCFLAVTVSRIVKMLVLLALSALPIMAMFVDLQRASFIALVLSAVTLLVVGIVKIPHRTVLPIVLLVILVLLFEGYFTTLIDGLSLKTSKVGLNMREQELMAVWNAASQNIWTLMLGKGWGSYFASPAVGYLNVTFTHSLLSYIFLKTGLVGLFLCLVYLFFIFEKLIQLCFKDGVRGVVLLWPFIIPVLLYASHKSFDYGLLLTLIVVLSTRKKGSAHA